MKLKIITIIITLILLVPALYITITKGNRVTQELILNFTGYTATADVVDLRTTKLKDGSSSYELCYSFTINNTMFYSGKKENNCWKQVQKEQWVYASEQRTIEILYSGKNPSYNIPVFTTKDQLLTNSIIMLIATVTSIICGIIMVSLLSHSLHLHNLIQHNHKES